MAGPITDRLRRGAAVLAVLLVCLGGCGARSAQAQGGAEPEATASPIRLKPRPKPAPAPSPTPVPARPPASAPETAELKSLLDDALAALPGIWDVWAEPLSGGAAVHCTHNLEQGAPMVSASLIKLFIMGAVYDRAEAGALEAEAVSADLDAMITVSDNSAANRLTLLLGGGDAAAGMAAVNAWAAELGCGGVAMNRLMLEENGLQNYVTAGDCALLLREIYRGSCVSAAASAGMLELLKAQQVNDRIPRGLPASASAAHKTGNLAGLCVADAGIVFSPGGDFLLCVISNGVPDDQGAAEAIVRITALAADALTFPRRTDIILP